jgi:hypothetical protein
MTVSGGRYIHTVLSTAKGHDLPPLLLLKTFLYCSKYDRTNKGGLSWEDVQAMILGNMNIVDPVGW